jgi:hypothetical protein
VSSARETLETIVPLVVPIVTGMVAAAGLAFKDHRLARDARSVRDRAFDEATSEVAFASEWWKAHQLLGSDGMEERTELALRWLAEAEAKVTSAQAMPVHHRPAVTLRRLLLLYPMHGWPAKALKAVFLICVAWLALASLVLVVEPVDSGAPGDREYEVIGLCLFALAMLPVRAWAAAADAGEHRSSSP